MHGASTRVSNELGAGRPQAARLAVRVVVLLAVSEGLAVGLILVCVRYIWGHAYSNVEEVVTYVAKMMLVIAVSNFFDGIQCVLSGAEFELLISLHLSEIQLLWLQNCVRSLLMRLQAWLEAVDGRRLVPALTLAPTISLASRLHTSLLSSCVLVGRCGFSSYPKFFWTCRVFLSVPVRTY